MSHTPTTSAPSGNATTAAKPSLTGVRIKQRKRQAQAAAKFEPEGGFFLRVAFECRQVETVLRHRFP